MSTFEKMELIEEIEALADEQGVGDLPLIQNLKDKDECMLMNLRDVLLERAEELAEAAGIPPAGRVDMVVCVPA